MLPQAWNEIEDRGKLDVKACVDRQLWRCTNPGETSVETHWNLTPALYPGCTIISFKGLDM